MTQPPGPVGTAVPSTAPSPGSATSNYLDWPVLIVTPTPEGGLFGSDYFGVGTFGGAPVGGSGPPGPGSAVPT